MDVDDGVGCGFAGAGEAFGAALVFFGSRGRALPCALFAGAAPGAVGGGWARGSESGVTSAVGALSIRGALVVAAADDALTTCDGEEPACVVSARLPLRMPR